MIAGVLLLFDSLYYCSEGYHRGEATDVVAYVAAHAKLFGLVWHSRQCQPSALETLTLTSSSDP